MVWRMNECYLCGFSRGLPWQYNPAKDGNLRDCLESLPEIRGQAYHADELQRIAAEARTRGKETTLQRLFIFEKSFRRRLEGELGM